MEVHDFSELNTVANAEVRVRSAEAAVIRANADWQYARSVAYRDMGLSWCDVKHFLLEDFKNRARRIARSLEARLSSVLCAEDIWRA